MSRAPLNCDFILIMFYENDEINLNKFYLVHVQKELHKLLVAHLLLMLFSAQE
jgi:hypothetical protein